MKFWKNLCKSKQSKKCLKSVLQDPLLTAKLGFFSYFVEMFKPFLILYQTDQPMLLYLYDDLPQSNLPSLLNKNNEDWHSNVNQEIDKKGNITQAYLKQFFKEVKLFALATILKPLEKIPLFSIWVFFHEHSQITWMQGKREGISLTPYYNFYPLHRHLDISRTITAGNSPPLLASSQTRTRNLWFPSASC